MIGDEMSRKIRTPPQYRKKEITVPNFYPSFELEWSFSGAEAARKIDVFSDWFLAEQMLAVRKIVNDKKLTRYEQFLNSRIKEEYQGDYTGYIFRLLRFKYWGRAEYNDHSGKGNDFYKKIDKMQDSIKSAIDGFIGYYRNDGFVIANL